jgi:hypothetical protein
VSWKKESKVYERDTVCIPEDITQNLQDIFLFSPMTYTQHEEGAGKNLAIYIFSCLNMT